MSIAELESREVELEAPSGLWREAWERLRRNPGAIVGAVLVLVFVIAAVFAPWLAPHDPRAQGLAGRLLAAPPSLDHPFGLDQLGRDQLSRVIYGARYSLLIGVVSVSVGLSVGLVLGALAGYVGGIVDSIVMRVIDIMLSIPGLLLAIGIVAVLGPGIVQIMIAVGVTHDPSFGPLLMAGLDGIKNKIHPGEPQDYDLYEHANGAPTVPASLHAALDALEAPDSTIPKSTGTIVSAEATLSYLLPNLEVYRALNGAGLSDPDLSERVTANVAASISRLLSLQNEDGGWNWWGRSFFLDDGTQANKSDPYISAYVFFGLVRAREIGMSVDEYALQRAGTYLSNLRPEISNGTSGAKLDEITFVQFVLAHANTLDEMLIGNLYNSRDRLSPSSQALLAYVIHKGNPADERVRDLMSNLETSAIMTASGAHWETPPENIFTTGSSIYTTSVVVYVLAQLDSANQVVFNAVRYLAAHRNARGLWSIGHENAWALIALNEAMVGFGDLNADFAYHATLNGGPLASGDVFGKQVLAPTNAEVPLEYLSPNLPNLLTIQREDGLGRLYYRAVLNVNRPVEDVRPIDAGMRIEREYTASDCKIDCPALSTLQLDSDKPITARLTLVLPNESHYVMVEDFIPAGMEILNRSLKTSQQGIDATQIEAQFEDNDPFGSGWGWWLFNEPQIRDDGILFTADYLPSGTYILMYTLIPLQSGEYRVLPAHAWESFFPEVQGTSAGAVIEIKPCSGATRSRSAAEGKPHLRKSPQTGGFRSIGWSPNSRRSAHARPRRRPATRTSSPATSCHRSRSTGASPRRRPRSASPSPTAA